MTMIDFKESYVSPLNLIDFLLVFTGTWDKVTRKLKDFIDVIIARKSENNDETQDLGFVN